MMVIKPKEKVLTLPNKTLVRISLPENRFMIGELENGKKHGEFLVCWESGIVYSIVYYVHDIYIGTYYPEDKKGYFESRF